MRGGGEDSAWINFDFFHAWFLLFQIFPSFLGRIGSVATASPLSSSRVGKGRWEWGNYKDVSPRTDCA